VTSDSTGSEVIQSIALILRTLIHVNLIAWAAQMMKYFVEMKAQRNPISKHGIFIVCLIILLVSIRILLHITMNPLTAVLILTNDVIPGDAVEAIFLVVRGFIVPCRDILEVSLICLMLRVQIKASHRRKSVHKPGIDHFKALTENTIIAA
jgi:hypothetical protein